MSWGQSSQIVARKRAAAAQRAVERQRDAAVEEAKIARAELARAHRALAHEKRLAGQMLQQLYKAVHDTASAPPPELIMEGDLICAVQDSNTLDHVRGDGTYFGARDDVNRTEWFDR